MRIGILFPSIYASLKLFPDRIFAPRELCIDLVNGLVAKGHDVTVYGVSDLPVNAKIISEPYVELPYHKFREDKKSDVEFAKHSFELRLVSRCFEDAKAGKLDIIHVYHDSSMFLSHYFQELLPEFPVVYTLHDPLPPEGTFEHSEFTRFRDHSYVSISNSFRHSSLQLNFVDTVYHGIDPAIYPFNDSPSDYYLFLSRLVPEKGLHSALAAALQAQEKLVVSTNFSNNGEVNAYYDGMAADMHNDLVTKLGVQDKPHRIELYRQAKALLFPIEWEEPFGIVLIEAMACGTPVIAYSRGSVSEIVADGETGFIVKDIDGIVDAMKKIGDINRRQCRSRIEKYFSSEKMIENYEKVYAKLCNSGI